MPRYKFRLVLGELWGRSLPLLAYIKLGLQLVLFNILIVMTKKCWGVNSGNVEGVPVMAAAIVRLRDWLSH